MTPPTDKFSMKIIREWITGGCKEANRGFGNGTTAQYAIAKATIAQSMIEFNREVDRLAGNDG